MHRSQTSGSTPPPRVLTIAGSDSSGGAGIQADLKTFTVMETYGMSVITAVTAQNTVGVLGAYPLTVEQIVAQLDAVLDDIDVDAVKTGMLVNADVVEAVADRLQLHIANRTPGETGGDAPSANGVQRNAARRLQLVVDPVMIAKSGDVLLEDASVTALQRRLFPLTRVVTPNIPEAEALTGVVIRTRDDMEEAGRRLLDFGVDAALVTGGHLPGRRTDDVLVTADDVVWFPGARIDTNHTHGTGCTLSATIAAALARKEELVEAVRLAKAFINAAITYAPGLGRGHGPTGHLAWLDRTVQQQFVEGKE